MAFDAEHKPDTGRHESQFGYYVKVLIAGMLLFGAFYSYISWMQIPNPLNKSVADTAITLIGLSMLLSGICYFWDFLDRLIVYRKYLGLIGFAFFVVHLILSWGAFMRLFSAQVWSKGIPWATFTGLLATIIFSIMAIISNRAVAKKLGGDWWRAILRTGYGAVILVWAHVLVLKLKHWMPWFRELNSPPPSSLLVWIFMLVVLMMRVALFVALKRKHAKSNGTEELKSLNGHNQK